jgi:hypothetical protein
VAADRVINALSPRVRNRKQPKAPRTPRVVDLLRKAIEWQALLESGEVSNQAAIARQEGITRARVTQVIGLLRLAPEIQEHVLSLPDMVCRPAITERALRPRTTREGERPEVEVSRADPAGQVGEGKAAFRTRNRHRFSDSLRIALASSF